MVYYQNSLFEIPIQDVWNKTVTYLGQLE